MGAGGARLAVGAWTGAARGSYWRRRRRRRWSAVAADAQKQWQPPVRGGGPAVGERSLSLVAQCGQQPVEVLCARAARAQVRREAGVAFLYRGARSHQVGVDMHHLHRLGASHVLRIGPQELIKLRPAVHELLKESPGRYPLAASAARSL